jgi:hypothetical protein
VYQLVAQGRFCSHEPMLLLPCLLPVEQERGGEISAVEDCQRVVRYGMHEWLGKAELAGTVVAEFGSADQVSVGIHQADRAKLRPGATGIVVRWLAEILAVLRRVGKRPDDAIDGIAAQPMKQAIFR